MSKKLTITIEKDDVGIGVNLDGNMDHRGLIHGAAVIFNEVRETTGISPGKFFLYAAMLAKTKPDVSTGIHVTIKGGVGDE